MILTKPRLGGLRIYVALQKILVLMSYILQKCCVMSHFRENCQYMTEKCLAKKFRSVDVIPKSTKKIKCSES